MIKKHILLLILIFMQIFYMGCKSDEELSLEAAIDEFEYLRYQEPIQTQKIENLKSKFENLDNNNVNVLYYLSEISRLQNKIKESHDFIAEAYEISHADSIYQQKQKIETLLPIKLDEEILTTSSSKEILFIGDNMLVFKTNENNEPLLEQTPQNKIMESDDTINQLIQTGRLDIQKLYNDKQYLSAINNTKMLIQLIRDLKEEKFVKKELSQLYQDLAILYSKDNNIKEAKIAIDKAIELNPSQENKEIKNLINNY